MWQARVPIFGTLAAHGLSITKIQFQNIRQLFSDGQTQYNSLKAMFKSTLFIAVQCCQCSTMQVPLSLSRRVFPVF